MWQPQKDGGQTPPVRWFRARAARLVLVTGIHRLFIFRYLYLGRTRYSHLPLHALTPPTDAALPSVQAHIPSQSHKQRNLVLFISLSMQGLLFLSRQPKFNRWGAWHKTSRTCLLFLLFPTFTQLVLHSLPNTPFFCPPWLWWTKLWEPVSKKSHHQLVFSSLSPFSSESTGGNLP